MTAIDLATGTQQWRTGKHQVRESMGISPDGREVFAKLMYDSIVSVSAVTKDFQTNWAIDAGIKYEHNPCPLLVNENLVIGATKNGLITSINRKSQSVEWMHKTGNSSVNNVLFDDKENVWITLTEGKIVRLTHK
jgi:glucose dehydrogenase